MPAQYEDLFLSEAENEILKIYEWNCTGKTTMLFLSNLRSSMVKMLYLPVSQTD